jgi:beta-mannanase
MMRKTISQFIIAGLILSGAYLIVKHKYAGYFPANKQSNTIEADSLSPVLAVFSFQPDAPVQIIRTFSHYKLKLYDADDWNISKSQILHLSDSIPLMITVETYGESKDSVFLTDPLQDVSKGKYDDVIKKLCSQLIGNRSNVYLRFDPEMEVPADHYPWQEDGTFYEEAFRHFAKLCKVYSPQVKLVWGPGGYPGEMEFYPGDDVVDAASVTIKGDSEISLKVYPTNYPIAYDLFRRLHRLRFVSKPIFIIGSKQVERDSINDQLLFSLAKLKDQEKAIIYSTSNFVRPEIKNSERLNPDLEIGVYDPQSLLNEEKSVTIEHLFVDFSSLKDGSFERNFNKVIKREHNIIVTFEPFRNPQGNTDLDVLQNVILGKYDKEINQLYAIIKQTTRMVYLRYAHEMEIPITRYPWQSQNPITYIKSFRYFMNFQNPFPANIKRIWGPAGDRGAIEWWPGNDVVDFVSIAIYGLPDKNITDPEKQETFSTIFDRKFWRLRFIDKPIFITEFGVKGSEDFQTKWLVEAAKTIRKNSQIRGVNYFNMSDSPKAWGEIKPPDWSISRKSFHSFFEALNKDEK